MKTRSGRKKMKQRGDGTDSNKSGSSSSGTGSTTNQPMETVEGSTDKEVKAMQWKDKARAKETQETMTTTTMTTTKKGKEGGRHLQVGAEKKRKQEDGSGAEDDDSTGSDITSTTAPPTKRRRSDKGKERETEESKGRQMDDEDDDVQYAGVEEEDDDDDDAMEVQYAVSSSSSSHEKAVSTPYFPKTEDAAVASRKRRKSEIDWGSELYSVLLAVPFGAFSELRPNKKATLLDWASIKPSPNQSLEDEKSRALEFAFVKPDDGLKEKAISELDRAVADLQEREFERLKSDFFRHKADIVSLWNVDATSEKKEHDLKTRYPNVLDKERSTLSHNAIDTLVTRLIELVDKEIRSTNAAIQSVSQSGDEFKSVLTEHLNMLKNPIHFEDAVVKWIRKESLRTGKKDLSMSYFDCSEIWANGHGGYRPIPGDPSLHAGLYKDLFALVDEVSKLLPTIANRSLDDLRGDHLDSDKEAKRIPEFHVPVEKARKLSSHGGYLPVSSRGLRPEYMCTYDHLQFTQELLPKSTSIDLLKHCSSISSSPLANLVLAPSATGKTGAAIRTLCKRGGLYMDFHGPLEKSQFEVNESFLMLGEAVKAKGNFPYLMSYVYMWILSQYLFLVFLCRKHGHRSAPLAQGESNSGITIPDLIRAQLNGNRMTISKIYKALIGLEMFKCNPIILKQLVSDAIGFMKEQYGVNTFDIVVLDEAQVIKEQRYRVETTKGEFETVDCPFQGPFFSQRGKERGLLSVIIQALLRITEIRTLFVMGTTHSLDLNDVLHSAILKRNVGWETDVVTLTVGDYIRTEHDLERVLRMLLNVDDCVEFALSDSRVKQLLPLRARIISETLYQLECMDGEQRRQDKPTMLRDAILKAYDVACASVFRHTAGDRSPNQTREAFQNDDAMIRQYGASVNRLFMADQQRSDDSLIRLLKSAMLGDQDPVVVESSQGWASRDEFSKSWLSVGLAGARRILLDKETARVKVIHYRMDEPLTRDVGRMLLHTQFSHPDNPSSDPDWPSHFARRVLDLQSSNADRELAVGYLFCRPDFQGKPLSELPFIQWDSTSEDAIRPEHDWLRTTKFFCDNYVPLKLLVCPPPLHNVVAVLDESVSPEKEIMLSLLGATVNRNVSNKTTHYISRDGMSCKRNIDTNKVMHVSEAWIDRCHATQRRALEVLFMSQDTSHKSLESDSAEELSTRQILFQLKRTLLFTPKEVLHKAIGLPYHAHIDILIIHELVCSTAAPSSSAAADVLALEEHLPTITRKQVADIIAIAREEIESRMASDRKDGLCTKAKESSDVVVRIAKIIANCVTDRYIDKQRQQQEQKNPQKVEREDVEEEARMETEMEQEMEALNERITEIAEPVISELLDKRVTSLLSKKSASKGSASIEGSDGSAGSPTAHFELSDVASLFRGIISSAIDHALRDRYCSTSISVKIFDHTELSTTNARYSLRSTDFRGMVLNGYSNLRSLHNVRSGTGFEDFFTRSVRMLLHCAKESPSVKGMWPRLRQSELREYEVLRVHNPDTLQYLAPLGVVERLCKGKEIRER